MKQVQSPPTVASDLVLPIARGGPGSTKHGLIHIGVHKFTCTSHMPFFFHIRQAALVGQPRKAHAHRFHPHPVAPALPGQIDARFSARGTVIARPRVLASSMTLSAGLTANFDTFGPPNDRDAFVCVLHAASARALILALANEFRLSVMRFISRSFPMKSVTFLLPR